MSIYEGREFRVLVMNSLGIPAEYEQQMFLIEKDTFGEVYERCPTTIDEYRSRYGDRNLSSVVCFRESEIVAYRIFQEISDAQVQSLFMVVKPAYRGRGLSTLICAFSHQYFKWRGFRHITSWTHVSITASKILAKFAPYVSEEEGLTEEELELMHAYEVSCNKPIGHYGAKRLVQHYYTMKNGDSGDARFWAHVL